MERNDEDRSERCMNEQCLQGPILVARTEIGFVGDLRTAVKVCLRKIYDAAVVDAMMARVIMAYLHDQQMIIAVGRSGAVDGSMLREIYARVMVHGGGELRTDRANYRVGITPESEHQQCDALVTHYRWVDALGLRGTGVLLRRGDSPIGSHNPGLKH